MVANSDVTFRLRGIPSQCSTKNAVQELVRRALSIHSETSFDVRSVAADPLKPTSRIATISFQDRPTLLSDRSAKEWVFPLQDDWYSDKADNWTKPLVFDTHFSGFTPLQNTKHEDCKVDLIALSGLGGHAFGSFKQKNGPFMWLRDALPDDIPTARILIYGYDTTTVQSSSFQNLTDLGRALQTDIRQVRVSEPHRPMIFIGHSLGGLVIKQAIVKMNEDKYEQDVWMLQSITAFLFFGVPHQGMATSAIVPLVGDRPNRALLESLGRNSDLLQRLQKDFERAFGAEMPKVVSYFETTTSPTAIQKENRWELGGPPELLVDPTSANFGSTDPNPVQRNHSELVKYPHLHDEHYQRVQAEISRLVGIACNAIPQPAPGTLADPLQITSSDIGFVALALAICENVSSCYETHKDRDEEITGLVRNSEELGMLLETIECHIPQLQNSHLKLAESIAASFVSELLELLNSSNPTVANRGKAKNLEDFREKCRTLLSADPLRRETILDLDHCINDYRDSISLALTAIKLVRTAQRAYASDGQDIRLVMQHDNGRVHFSLEDETGPCTPPESSSDSSLSPVRRHMGNEGIQIDMWPKGAHCEIIPRNAQGMSLNLWGGYSRPGTEVKLYRGNRPDPNSLWEIIDAGRGEHHIRNDSSGLYLCTKDHGINKKVVGNRPGKTNWRWRIIPAGNGWHHITTVDKKYYLNVSGNCSHEGTNLIIWKPEVGSNSQFKISTPG